MQAIMETIFELLYLFFAIESGILLLIKGKKKKNYILFGLATLLLGVGDSFHLIPRMMALWTTDGFDKYVVWLGIGKLVTSITMTIFYVVLFYFFRNRYNKKTPIYFDVCYLSLAIIRIALCAFPQNEWFISNSNYYWGIYRNIPFVLMGIIFVILTFNWCKQDQYFKFTWLLVTLSFVFYLLTVLVAPFVSFMGMMMLPKTVCYVILIIFALKSSI